MHVALLGKIKAVLLAHGKRMNPYLILVTNMHADCSESTDHGWMRVVLYANYI